MENAFNERGSRFEEIIQLDEYVFKLKSENQRLRAALEKIADADPDWISASDFYDVRNFARDALKGGDDDQSI